MPLLVVVGGPNGSGKTTLTAQLIKRGRIKTAVINPDDIALTEFGSYKFHIPASREALQRRKNALVSKSDVAFETTFSGKSEIADIRAAHKGGYRTILYFVALESLIDNIIRVEERAHNNGHKVELEDMIRRYNKIKLALQNHIALFNRAYLFDNSGTRRSRVAIFEHGNLVWLNTKHENHPFYQHLFSPLPTPPPLQG
ncbi:hypothetical protein A0256_05330 [Mucilaginibacter sp. PAMC 26640]|nr:hypothetical protein A0256_05330 [Mucilaginibacter sp. PAMC 26640]